MKSENQYAEVFRQEAYELLTHIEDAILDMEEHPEDAECIHRIFRSIHTIKGSGAMFGFNDMAGFAHHLESALSKIREGDVPVTRELTDLIFLAKDQIRAMLDEGADECGPDLSVCQDIIDRLKTLMPDDESDPCESDSSAAQSEKRSSDTDETIYRIRFRPSPDIMASGMDPANILQDIRELGYCEVVGHTKKVPLLDALNPEQCFLSWDILLATAQDMDALRDVFIFVEDESDIRIRELTDDPFQDADEPRPRIGEILLDRGDISARHVHDALGKQKRFGELLVESGEVSRDDVMSALAEQKIVAEKIRKRHLSASQMASVRISSDKLDSLINLVGEMVITQSRLNLASEHHGESEFSKPIREMERLTSELRSFALEMRMLPVGTLFSRFRRLIRDLSADLGKDVALVVEGGEAELDKTILDRLHDPLVHLIRNSIDHGFRSPDERELHDKPRKGTIRLAAAHRGARVDITISDDGMGIDQTAIRTKALENGLISEDDDLTEEELLALIFAPGFSTARQVSDVSGRGVGMDVVKREIRAIGGTIQISSKAGEGTSVHLSMPLTMAIVEGFQVRISERDFILPVSQVDICAELKGFHQEKSEGQNMIWVGGDLIPFIRLREIFSIPGDIPHVENVAAVQAGKYRVGIVVDEIIGNIQTVIKPLDRLYRHAKGISGSTIMADGTVALIVDIPELVRCAKQQERTW